MTFTKLTLGRDAIRRTSLNLSTLLALVAGARTRKKVMRLRERLSQADSSRTAELLKQWPVIVAGGEWHAGMLTAHSGLMLLNFNRLPDEQTAERIKRDAARIPHTYLALRGGSGRSVKVLVRCVLPDGTLPLTSRDWAEFLAEAYALAALHYCPNVTAQLLQETPSPLTAFRLCYDPAPYYNANATPFIVSPARNRRESFQRRARQAGVLPRKPKTATHISTNQETKKKNKPSANGPSSSTPNNGTPPETGHTQPSITTRLNDFMTHSYEVRRNILKNEVEIRPLNKEVALFQPLTTARFNRLVMEIMEAGIPVWDKDVKRYIQSDGITEYQPLSDYLNHLPAWDGHDHIGELAQRVPNNHPLWKTGFRYWLTGVVAQWTGQNPTYGNCLTPVLIGNQGDGKSTFCRRLVPPFLTDYYTDRIDLSNRRDAELSLGRFALVNLDEFDQTSNAQQAFLKHLLQKTEITARRPYETATVRSPRYASFIATTNAMQPLCDITGSRRYLCVELTGRIDNKTPLEHEQLYAQALHLLNNGQRHWLTPDEELQLTELNRSFQQCDIEEDFLNTTFRRPVPTDVEEHTAKELTVLEIALHLKNRYPHMPYDRGTLTRITRLLTRDGYPRRREGATLTYRVVELT